MMLPPLSPTLERLEGRALRAAVVGPIHSQLNIVYETVNGRSEALDVYTPSGPAPAGGRPALLAIHGGGWRRFDKSGYGRQVAAEFVPAGFVVVAVDYQRSGPGAPSWPANLNDVRAAASWVRGHAASEGIAPNRIAAIGESAGGHLAALLGTDPGSASAAVNAVVAFYGPTDLTRLYNEARLAGNAAAQYLGGTPIQVPLRYADASPVNHVASGDPPMLLIHGTNDPVVPIDQSRALAAALTAAGVPNELITVGGAGHGFEFQTQGRKLVPEVLAFLKAT